MKRWDGKEQKTKFNGRNNVKNQQKCQKKEMERKSVREKKQTIIYEKMVEGKM